MILNNNLIFSLSLSLIIATLYYLFSTKINNENDDKNNILILFGISFSFVFIFKVIISNKDIIKSGEHMLSHSSRPPF